MSLCLAQVACFQLDVWGNYDNNTRRTSLSHFGWLYSMEYNYCWTNRNKVFYYVLFPRCSPEEFQMKILLKISSVPKYVGRRELNRLYLGPRDFISTFRSWIREFNIQDDVSEPWKCHYTAMWCKFVHFQRVFVTKSSFRNCFSVLLSVWWVSRQRFLFLSPLLFLCLCLYSICQHIFE